MSAAAEQVLAPHLERCFWFDAIEDSYEIHDVTGSIPRWLRGTYYVNGPACFERAGMRYRHWLDGDGMVCALRFSGDGVRFTNRFVMTHKRKQEDAAGRFLFRSFGTAFRGDKLRRGIMIEPPVNVSVYPYDGRLLAFGEQTLPVALDPVTLETLGEYDFSGKLNEVSPFAAHAKFDPVTGHLFNFGISYSAAKPALHLYEFDAAGRLVRRRRHRLDMPHSNHDFALSQEHVVFFLSPLVMDFERFWDQDLSVMESLSWQPQKGSRILVLPRNSRPDEAFQIAAGSGYCLHLINCFEQGRQLIVDILELEAPVYPEYQPIPDLFSNVIPGRPARYVIDLDSRQLASRESMPYEGSPDFPSIDSRLAGRPYDDFWMLGIAQAGRQGRKFFNQLAHGSWSRGEVDHYEVPGGEYLGGEPICVSNPDDPSEAVIVVEHFDARNDQAAFVLFDAMNVSKGPLARLPLRHKIHPGFHASFSWAA